MPNQLTDFYKSFIWECPVVSIEVPIDQNDWKTFKANIQVVGDDVTVTDPRWIDCQGCVGKRSCNCLLLRLNQICSVTKSLQTCKLAGGVMASPQLWGD